jgi:cofilin
MQKKYRSVVLKLSEDYKNIIVESLGETSQTYEDLVKALPPNQPRFIVFDYHHVYDDGRK